MEECRTNNAWGRSGLFGARPNRLFCDSRAAAGHAAVLPVLLIETGALAAALVALIAVLDQVAELELVLDIIILHHSSALADAVAAGRGICQEGAPEAGIRAAARLHTAARGEARDAIGRGSVAEVVSERARTVGVVAREVEEVDAREDDEEAAQERDCVDGRGGVEAAEEEERCNEGAGCERHVVKRVHAVFVSILEWKSLALCIHIC